MKEENLEALQKEIHVKEELLKNKEKELIETKKNISSETKNTLTEEIETLKTDINQKQIHFDKQLLLKNERISNLEENNNQLQKELNIKKEETQNLRDQHEKTLIEIKKQIEYYQTQVAELEKEAEELKQKIKANNEKTEQSKIYLTNKQEQLNKFNLELGKLQTQKTSLEQEINTLNKTYQYWLAQCEIKKDKRTLYVSDNLPKETIEEKYKNRNEQKYTDNTIYYAPEPFQVELKPYFKNVIINPEAVANENKQIFKAEKTKINGTDVYYIKIFLFLNNGEIIQRSLSYEDIKSCFNNKYFQIEKIEMKFSHDVSLTPPSKILNEENMLYLKDKMNEILDISNQTTKLEQELNQTQQEMKDLIEQTTPDETLEIEVQKKEKHIKDLKKEMDELTLKEKGFQTEIQTLTKENENLKAKYDNDLKNVIIELKSTKTINAQLEAEIAQIQEELKKTNQTNNNLIKTLNDKQEKIKELQTKITTLEENEKKLKDIIKTKDEEIAKLEKTVKEQATEINRLNAEIERQIELYIEQGKHIQNLEGTIKGLEEANQTLSSDNQELLLKIKELRQQLEDEKKAHKNTRDRLNDKIKELTKNTQDLQTEIHTLQAQQKIWNQNKYINAGAKIGDAMDNTINNVIGDALGGFPIDGIGKTVGTAAGLIVENTNSHWNQIKKWWNY
ncbi:hypothetical protein [Candidatus Phytoplasma sp. AldY-WA1]|uniref:hypothetical protein n=1 Tax=Candidatus Phytoplasma sp. AldY-WA1 TaxID=2852100 RepID=UPI002550C9F7|nr:hypothetical protein [Candidatus Phytoplasma sp. AldY-WA1]